MGIEVGGGRGGAAGQEVVAGGGDGAKGVAALAKCRSGRGRWVLAGQCAAGGVSSRGMSTAIPPEAVVSALNWRYATKKFDPVKKIPGEVWAALEQALILAPSSMGLQPWKFIVVTNQAVKEQLVGASYKQTQAADCSHMVVFAVRKNLGAEHVEKYLGRVAEVKAVTRESLEGFGKMIAGNLARAAKEGRLDTWQTHQIYIALGQFMTAAALLGVDTCPMEGIENARYDEILGLGGGDYATVVACPAGYRAFGDKYAEAKKVRFETADVIVRV